MQTQTEPLELPVLSLPVARFYVSVHYAEISQQSKILSFWFLSDVRFY